jgi:hypothetical protein
VVASNADTLPRPDWSVARLPEIARDLGRFIPMSDDALASTLLITSAELAPLMADADQPNSDFHPRLDLGAERARFLRHSAAGFLGLSTDRFDAAAALGGRVIPLTTDTRASLSHDRVLKQVIAARLRRGEVLPSDDTTNANRGFQSARLRAQQLQQGMASGVPPADWFVWFTQMVAVEHDRHGGTMGVADGAWFREVERYMVAEGAPRDGISALRFLWAAVAYDWPTAAAEVETLIEARNEGRQWLPRGLFLDAAVIARLRTGDAAGAESALARLSATAERETGDLRTRLLAAAVAAAVESSK